MLRVVKRQMKRNSVLFRCFLLKRSIAFTNNLVMNKDYITDNLHTAITII